MKYVPLSQHTLTALGSNEKTQTLTLCHDLNPTVSKQDKTRKRPLGSFSWHRQTKTQLPQRADEQTVMGTLAPSFQIV